MSVDIFR